MCLLKQGFKMRKILVLLLVFCIKTAAMKQYGHRDVLQAVRQLHVNFLKQSIQQSDTFLHQQKKTDVLQTAIHKLNQRIDGLSAEIKWLRSSFMLGMVLLTACIVAQLEYQYARCIWK